MNNSHVELEVKPSVIGYIGRNLALSIALIPIILIFIFYLLWRFGIVAWYFRKKMDERVIQKVAPLALMGERRVGTQRQFETSPLLIKRTVRSEGQNRVVDLRRK